MGLPLHLLHPAELAVEAIASECAVHALPPAQLGTVAVAAAVAVPLLSAASLPVLAGPFVAGVPAVEPGLWTFHYSFGGKNAYFTLNGWDPSGVIRYRVEDLTAGGFLYSDWSSLGTSDASMYATNLVVGHLYRLDYLLDCTPDVPGWDDAAYRDLGIQWVQPDRFSPPIDGDWERN